MKNLFLLFALLTLSVGMWAENSVITFTSTAKLYPGERDEWIKVHNKRLEIAMDYPGLMQYLLEPDDFLHEVYEIGIGFFSTGNFLDATGQPLGYSYNYSMEQHYGTITFNGELVTINEVFRDCLSMTSIAIPASVTTIGDCAFRGCNHLTDIYVSWISTLPILGNDVFYGAPINTATLHVPAGSSALYKAADRWQDFGTIVEYGSLADVKTAAIAEIDAAIVDVTDAAILAIAKDAKDNINIAPTVERVDIIKAQALAEIGFAKAKIAAIGEIDLAIEGVTDEYIIAIAVDAKTDIPSAKTIEAINFVKTLAIAKINAIKEINDAIKDLTLFSAEESYIDFIKSSIQQGDDVNLIQEDKKLGLDYIALHDAKLAAIAAVKHDMGDYAESEAIYNFIGGPAIEEAVDADKVTEAKNAALAKLEEFSQVLGAANMAGYKKGKEDGIEEALGAMGEPCTDCMAVEVTDGTTTVTLYAPTGVDYIKK